MLPSEYRGRARVLRWRVEEVDGLVRPAIDHALQRVRERLQRHPKRPVREATLIDARRLWLSLPAYGSIERVADISNRYAPSFLELRVSAVRFATDLWDGGDDDGLAISLVIAKVERGRLREESRILGAASLHALGRRLMRGRDQTDMAVFRDLAAIAYAFPQLVESAEDRFGVVLPHGSWAGNLLMLDGFPSALARTFLDEQQGYALPTMTGDLEALIGRLPELAIREPSLAVA